jgi:hypothetical protein
MTHTTRAEEHNDAASKCIGDKVEKILKRIKSKSAACNLNEHFRCASKYCNCICHKG